MHMALLHSVSCFSDLFQRPNAAHMSKWFPCVFNNRPCQHSVTPSYESHFQPSPGDSFWWILREVTSVTSFSQYASWLCFAGLKFKGDEPLALPVAFRACKEQVTMSLIFWCCHLRNLELIELDTLSNFRVASFALPSFSRPELAGHTARPQSHTSFIFPTVTPPTSLFQRLLRE